MKIKIIYYLRWIISGIVMLPVMSLLNNLDVPLWINLLVGQSFGALIFWNIDKRIFRR